MKLSFRAILVLALALATRAVVAAPPARAGEDVKVTLGRSALQGILSAATPYRLDIGSSLLRESLTFTDPGDLALSGGKIRFSIHCQGTPFPVDQVLHPVLSVRPAGNGVYQVVVESLPLRIPGYGSVDLREVVEPVNIQSLLRETVLLDGGPAELEVRVRRITIRAEEIEIGASLTLTRFRSR